MSDLQPRAAHEGAGDQLGEIAGLRADHVVAAHKDHYLRGRTVDDLEAQLRLGLARAGVADIASFPTELAGLQACVEAAEDGDVAALTDVMRVWLTRHKRWGSPVYLAGESYGTTRGAALADKLQGSGVALSGLILISCAMDLQSIVFCPANDLPYSLFLPAFANVSQYHGLLKGALAKSPAAAPGLPSVNVAVVTVRRCSSTPVNPRPAGVSVAPPTTAVSVPEAAVERAVSATKTSTRQEPAWA